MHSTRSQYEDDSSSVCGLASEIAPIIRITIIMHVEMEAVDYDLGELVRVSPDIA